MDFYAMLEINQSFLRQEEYASMAIAARAWAECGMPTKRPGLSDALEIAIKRCKERGIRYAPILLRRKRSLERGEWAPRLPEAIKETGMAAPTDACEWCGGGGYKMVGSMMSICECGAWKKKTGGSI